MIDVYALEPELVATWGRRSEYRFIHDKFGLGTPRAMLEFPSFTKWKRAVYDAATRIGLNDTERVTLAQVFQLLSEHKCRRAASVYEGPDWLRNAEAEHDRQPFPAILATDNPRQHGAVITADRVGDSDPRWNCDRGATPKRTPAGLADALTGMLVNCRELHLVDPHFGPENKRHREVLRAFLRVIADKGGSPKICIYCSAKAEFEFFQTAAETMAHHLPRGVEVAFIRLTDGRESLHNRYVLTDLGGVALGVGLDTAKGTAPEQTDDVLLMPRDLYMKRWSQYVEQDGAFAVVDRPRPVIGTAQREVHTGRFQRAPNSKGR